MNPELPNDKEIGYLPVSPMPPPSNTTQLRLPAGGNMDSPKLPADLPIRDPSSTPFRAMSRLQSRGASEAMFMDYTRGRDFEGDKFGPLEDADEVEEIIPEDFPAAALAKSRSYTFKGPQFFKAEPIKKESFDDHNISRNLDSHHGGKGFNGRMYAGNGDKTRPIDLTDTPDATDYRSTAIAFLSDDEDESEDNHSAIIVSDDDEVVEPPVSPATAYKGEPSTGQVDYIDLDSDIIDTGARVRRKLGKLRRESIKLTIARDRLKAKEEESSLSQKEIERLEQLQQKITYTDNLLNAHGDTKPEENDDSDSDEDGSDNSDEENDSNGHVDEGDTDVYEADNDGNKVEKDLEDEEYEKKEKSNDDDDDYQPTKSSKKRKQTVNSQVSKPKKVSAPPSKKRKTKRSKPKRSKQQRDSRPLTAQEWWEREYERNSESNVIPNLLAPKGSGGPPKKATWRPNGAEDQQVLEMLKDVDPVNARAAMDTTMLLDEGSAQTRKDQERQLRANLKTINDSMTQKNAQKEMKLLNKAMGSFGYGKCKHVNGRYLLPGMKTSLFNHQLVGVHFMLSKEFSPFGPYGGILADQMGLGKTVQMLACMAQNRGDGPTLIVAPAAAIEQWKSELKKHCDFATRMWHYSDKNTNQHADQLKKEQIVIASYQAIAKAFPSDEALRRISGENLGMTEWRDRLKGAMGDAFLIDWHRVVLDEAHAIKNHLSRTSKACIHLRSKHRWALSGTPIHNNIEELFPYMKFLRVEWAADMKEFKKKFGGTPGDDDSEKARLAAVVPSLMIRRRVHDTFMGQPILRIPPTHPVKTISVELSTEEKFIYHRLEARFRDNMNRHIEQGVVAKKLRTYFVYLTRLRQCTSHPFLLENSLRWDFELEDIVWLRERLAEEGGQTPLRTHISKWIKDEEARRLEDDQIGGEVGTPGVAGFGKSDFGGVFEMNEQLERIEAEKTAEDLVCRACTELPHDSQITQPCGHTFCKDCIEPVMHNAEVSNQEPKCPHCRTVVKSYKSLQKLVGRNKNYEQDTDDEVDEQVGNQVAPASRKRMKKKSVKKKGPQPGDDAQGIQPKSSEITKFLDICDKTPEKPVTPSAKTTAIKLQVLEWLQKFPDDKIIIFTHWIPLARILGRVFEAEKIRFLYYFGSMSVGQRKAAVDTFTTKTGEEAPKLLIASTKCGGQALNLTVANRVILVDLWWNTAVERQAFGRVHRIGQTKDTYYVKIVTRKTVDERLLDMQAEKDAKISETLQDGDHKAKPLTIADIHYLIAGGDDTEDFNRHRRGSPDEEDGSLNGENGDGEEGGIAIRQGKKRPMGPDADTKKIIKRRRVPPKSRPKSIFKVAEEDTEVNEGLEGSQEGLEGSQDDQDPKDDPQSPDESQDGHDLVDAPMGADESDQPRPSIEGGDDSTESPVVLADLAGGFDGLMEADERPAPNMNPFVEASDSEEDEETV